MNSSVRSIILKKVTGLLKSANNGDVQKIMSHLQLRINESNGIYSFMLPLKSKDYDIAKEAQNIRKDDSDHIFSDITIESKSVYFNILRDKYVKEVLESNCLSVTPPLHTDNNRNIIVEFSSPNIAKPFHLGHLRSTIIGNYVANINKYLQHKVKKINYLGDWGTQFGFVVLGVELANIPEEEMKLNPIKALYNAYTIAHKKAETDSSISNQAREIFRRLETGDEALYKDWDVFKACTIEELRKTYERIGIFFDEYHWESMYSRKNIRHIIALMEEMQLLSSDEDNKKVIPLSTERNIPIIKSDGSTLYITRDLAAAIDRYERNKFDTMYYVVDNAQTDHFSNLVQILNKMDMPWAEKLKHVKYGRVRGMSTRKGTAVFLEDILNKARDIMRDKQMRSTTTKVSLDLTDNSADILGTSAVIIHDLKQRRQRDYTFDWNSLFDVKGDSGLKLQYTHCRLVNLERNCGAVFTAESDPSLLKEPEVDDLIVLIGKFDEVVQKSYQELEACVLTVYLFQLSNAINKAMKKLRIKGVPSDLGSQRLLLFHTAKNIFAEGMKLLGLKPLDRM